MSMRILVVGLGSIAHRHIQNLKLIDPSIRIALWRQKSKSIHLQELAPLVDQVMHSLNDAVAWKPDAALITNPASLHVEAGLALAQQNIHLFIEKPLSNELNGVNELLDLCRSRSLVLMVGYNFRFDPSLQKMRRALIEGQIGQPISLRAEVGQFLPGWRSGRDYRQSVSAQSALGGGAVLELSHELDYARWLMGEVKKVSAQVANLGELDMDAEDIAEIILQFDNGALGSIHLDMIQRSATRVCRIIGTEGTLAWDCFSHSVRLFSATTNTWSDLQPSQPLERNEMYVAELEHFLDCFTRSRSPLVSGEDGRRALEIALAVKESSRSQQVVEL